jgi:hypothetical protein
MTNNNEGANDMTMTDNADRYEYDKGRAEDHMAHETDTTNRLDDLLEQVGKPSPAIIRTGSMNFMEGTFMAYASPHREDRGPEVAVITCLDSATGDRERCPTTPLSRMTTEQARAVANMLLQAAAAADAIDAVARVNRLHR